jgi:hypothetical protein
MLLLTVVAIIVYSFVVFMVLAVVNVIGFCPWYLVVPVIIILL